MSSSKHKKLIGPGFAKCRSDDPGRPLITKHSSAARIQPTDSSRPLSPDTCHGMDGDTWFWDQAKPPVNGNRNVPKDNMLYHTFVIESEIKPTHVTALLDSGASVNIVSETFYNSLPKDAVSHINRTDSCDIKVASGQIIPILGSCTIRAKMGSGNSSELTCIILKNCSHPIILGCTYLQEHHIILNFSNLSSYSDTSSLKLASSVSLAPHSHTLVQTCFSSSVPVGTQGVCAATLNLEEEGVLCTRSLVTQPPSKTIMLNLYNADSSSKSLMKDTDIATFTPCDNDTLIHTSLSHPEASVGEIDDHIVDSFYSENFQFETPDITDTQLMALKRLLYENRDVFITKDNPDIGVTPLLQHSIHLKDDYRGRNIRPYRLSPTKREVLRHHLEHLEAQGIISKVCPNDHTAIVSPIVLVEKGKPPVPFIATREQSLKYFRFVVDYRYLNTQILNFQYHIPDVSEITESLAEAQPRFFSTLDQSLAFYQVPLEEKSSVLTAFNCAFGTYKMNRLPMGLKTSTAAQQLLVDNLFKDMLFRSVFLYIDDLIAVSHTFDDHLAVLREIFARFRSANLRFSCSKSAFFQSKIVFLGHEVSASGIVPPPGKLDPIRHYPVPTSQKEILRWLGLVNWFAKYVPHFSVVAKPLYRLTKDNVPYQWDEACQQSFDRLKELLLSPTVLRYPRHDLMYHIMVDASKDGIGYILYQLTPEAELPDSVDESGIRVIRYGSKCLKDYQSSYAPTKLELLGLVTAVTDCSGYIRGRQAIVLCDHSALKPLAVKRYRGAIFDRWISVLTSYDLTLQPIAGRHAAAADALSRAKNPTNELVSSPDEENYFFPYFQEQPEPELPVHGIKLRDFFNGMFADCATQTSELDTTFLCATELVSLHDNDKLSSDCDEDVSPLSDYSDTSTESAHCSRDTQIPSSLERSSTETSIDDFNLNANTFLSAHDFSLRQKEDPRLKPYIDYFANGELPSSQKAARNLLLQKADFAYIDGILFYKAPCFKPKTLSQKYRLVLPTSLQELIVSHFHNSVCGAHAGIGVTLTRLKNEYFFWGMDRTVSDYIRTCSTCQARKIHKHTRSDIHALMKPSAPFMAWQIDLYGPLPRTPRGHSYIFTAICLFSKLNYTAPLVTKEAIDVAEALFGLICTYGACSCVIHDQGSEFLAEVTRRVCELCHISQQLTPAYSSHCLGALERTHRDLANKLYPYLNAEKTNWDKYLQAATFAMNTALQSSLGYSPFEVVYGHIAAFPASQLIGGPHMADIHPDIRSYLNDLTHRLTIIRDQAKVNMQIASDKMCDTRNASSHPLPLQPGEYVYLRKEAMVKGAKLHARFEGPYKVESIVSTSLVTLSDPTESRKFLHPVHVNRLKRAHVREQSRFTPFPHTPNTSTLPPLNVEEPARVIDDMPSVTDQLSLTVNAPTIRRSARLANKPRVHFQDVELSSEEDIRHRVKRVVAQHVGDDGTVTYLCQLRGEPATYSRYLPLSALNPKQRKQVLDRPPPAINS